MDKENKLIIGIAAVFAVIVVLLAINGMFNGMIEKRNAVDKSWGDVQTSYQARLDTIPKFVETAKFSIDFQKKLAIDYAAAREKLSNPGPKDDLASYQTTADNNFDALVINVRQEAVPEAKLDQLTELNSEIDSAERVIRHQRDAYNQRVKEYNDATQFFPNSWFAGMWKFEARKYFEADKEASKSPEVKLL